MSHQRPEPDPLPGERLSAWLDGELSDAEQRELEAELARDPALRADLEALEGVVRLVREEAPTVAPPGFHQRVMARAAELEPARPGFFVVVASWLRRWEAIALAGVAVAALLLALPFASSPEAPTPDAPVSPGAVRLSPPADADPGPPPAVSSASEPVPVASPAVPKTQVVGRARVEPSPPELARELQNGTNLSWEPGAPTATEVPPQAVTGEPPAPDAVPSLPPPPAPANGRFVVSSDDPGLKRRVLALAARYGEVRDPSGRPVATAERAGTEELVVTVSQAELPAFTRGLQGLGFDVGPLPGDLLAGDRVELRLVLVGSEPRPARSSMDAEAR